MIADRKHAISAQQSGRALRVTVLAGGPSAEREVSLESGAAIAAALRNKGHDVFISDINPEDLSALDREADVIFPALHGTFGEDGALQRILEARSTPFVGSGSTVSAITIDKLATKQAAERIGITTPPYEVLKPEDRPSLTPPVVIKPLDQGSSVGTLIVREAAELEPALARICAQFGRALVEQFIDGDELTVGVVGDQTLPPICIRPKRGFYDYEAKYHADDTEYLFDADLPPGVLSRAEEWSLRLFQSLGCRHLARVDWMVDRAGGLWFLEVNTLPGFTSHSLVPKAAQRVGVTFEELCDHLVSLALKEKT